MSRGENQSGSVPWSSASLTGRPQKRQLSVYQKVWGVFWLLMIMGSFQCLLYTQVLMIITAEASCEVTNLLLHYEEVKDEKIRRQDQSLKARDSSDWH